MRAKNNKGFMLAEIIIVATIVSIGLVSLFTLTTRMLIKYEKKIVYDTVDPVFVSKGLARNYSKNIIDDHFSGKITSYYSFEKNEFTQKNNIVVSYIAKYTISGLNALLSNISEENANFYDFVNDTLQNTEQVLIGENYVLYDSVENNTTDEDTYEYIIFTSISNNCTIDEGTGEKTCVEDNISSNFGSYKFNYYETGSSNKDIIVIDDEDKSPPVISSGNHYESQCGYYSTNCDIGDYTVFFSAHDDSEIDHFVFVYYRPTGVSLNGEAVVEYIGTMDVPVSDEMISSLNNGTSCSYEDNGIGGTIFLKPGNSYYIKIYGVDKNGNSGENYCDEEDSSYCYKIDSFTPKHSIPVTKSGDSENLVYIATHDSIDCYGCNIKYTINKSVKSGYTITLNSVRAYYKSDATTQLNPLINTTSTGTYTINNVTEPIIFYIDVTKTANSGGGGSCLTEGTRILLADGTYKNIEDITYNDLLVVVDYQNGGITYQYPVWLEKRLLADTYIKITFSDDTTINVVGDHAFFSYDDSEFVVVSDKEKFHVGTRVAKLKNYKLDEVKVKKIEYINEEIYYHHVISTRYYNVIAEDIVTTDNVLFVTNLYGFNSDITWENSPITDVYAHEEIPVAPYYVFRGLRMYEGKLFNKAGMNKEMFINFLLENQLNETIWDKPKLNENGKREWMVTTSDDIVTEENKLSYLMEEGDFYTLKEPKMMNNKKFIGWYHTGEATFHQPGDKVEVMYGTHFEAKWGYLFGDASKYDKLNRNDNRE